MTQTEMGFYGGMCDMALEKYGVSEKRRQVFLTHPEVKTWEIKFLLSQVLQYISGIRNEIIHDIPATCLPVDHPPKKEGA